MPVDALGALLCAAVLVVGVLLFRRFSVFANLCKERLRAGDWSPVPRSQAPMHTQLLLRTAEDALLVLGFERLGCLGRAPQSAFDPRLTSFTDIYWQESHTVIAYVEPAMAESGKAYSVRFFTPLRDGPILLTLNREVHTCLPYPPGVVVEDSGADSLAAQWQSHLDRLAALPAAQARETDRATALACSRAWSPSARMSHWRAAGWILPAGGNFRYTLRGAWLLAHRLCSPPAKVRAALRRPYDETPTPDRRAVSLSEVDAVVTHVHRASAPPSSRAKAAACVLILALGAFIGFQALSFAGVGALLVALLVHEAGHWLAMRVVDYRNPTVFVLPVLGATANGRKLHVSTARRVLVLLAGSVLGLLVAGFVACLPARALSLPTLDFARAFVLVSLALNLVNLLPVPRLDGGRIFEQAVLGRLPYTALVVRLVVVVVALALAIQDQNVLAGLLAIVLALGLASEFGTAALLGRVLAKVGGKRGAFEGRRAQRALAECLADSRYFRAGKSPWRRRRVAALRALPRLAHGVPGLSVSLAALGALFVSIALPLAVMAWVIVFAGVLPLWEVSQAEALRSESLHEQNLAAFGQTAPGQRVLARFGTHSGGDEADSRHRMRLALLEENALFCQQVKGSPCEPPYVDWLVARRADMISRLPPDHVERLRARLEAAAGLPSPRQALEALAVTRLLTQGGARPLAVLDPDQQMLWGLAYEKLASVASPEEIQSLEAEAGNLWFLSMTGQTPNADLAARIAETRARVAVRAGDPQEADVWMQRYLHAVRKRAASGADATVNTVRLEAAQRVYGWFLLDIGNPETAFQVATRPHADDATAKAQWLSLAGWCEMVQGRPREADEYFLAALSAAGHAGEVYNRPATTWWARLLPRSDTAAPRRVSPQLLDHIAALQAYSPDMARQELAKLPRQVDVPPGETPVWGKARQIAHRQIRAGG